MLIMLDLIENKDKQISLKASGRGFISFLWQWYSTKLTFRPFILPYCDYDVNEWKIKTILWQQKNKN